MLDVLSASQPSSAVDGALAVAGFLVVVAAVYDWECLHTGGRPGGRWAAQLVGRTGTRVICGIVGGLVCLLGLIRLLIHFAPPPR